MRYTTQEDNTAVNLAFCGSDVYWIKYGNKDNTVSWSRIYVTSQGEPSHQQGAIAAAARIPGLASLMCMVSNTDCLIVDLDDRKKVVPRTIPVRGTPSRLIYSARLSCFVAAAIETSARGAAASTSNPQSSERRTHRALIDFRPPGVQDWAYTFLMQAGERVYALQEWSYRNTEGKDYVFILAATGIIHENGRSRGWIHLLQPIVKRRQIVDVKLATSTKFDDPVYALALYDDRQYVACHGSSLVVYEYAPQDKK